MCCVFGTSGGAMKTNGEIAWRGGAALLFLVSGAAASPQDLREEDLAALIRDADSPGVQYIHASRDSSLKEAYAGVLDLSTGSAVRRDTTFMGFSVTKTFTALAILLLAEEKKISLDDEIRIHLRHFPYSQSPTIRQTLNHTGGFPNPIPMAWSHLETEHAGFDRTAFVRSVLSTNPDLKSVPGEKFAYSNLGYLLLGQVIENVSGQTYEGYVQEKIIRPLVLGEGETLAFELRPGQATGYLKRWSLLNLASGWLFDRDRFIGGRHGSWNYFNRYYVNGSAYGGLTGNAAGFTRFLQAFLPGGIFSRFASQMAAESQTQTEDFPVSLGWYKGTLDGQEYFAHAGGGGGYYCEIRFYPKAGRTSAVMLNRTGVSDERLLDKLDANRFKERTGE